MYDYYAVPNQYNGFKTLHGYWMEDTHGRIGIDVEVFGPYRMPAKSVRVRPGHRLQRGRRQPGQLELPRGPHVQPEHPHRRPRRLAGRTGCASLASCGFNNGFYVTAGHDESSTWQEFGEML